MELSDRAPSGIVQLIADSPMPDPEEPVETLVMVEEALPRPAKRPVQIRLVGLAGLLSILAVAAISWQWAPFWLWSVVAPWVEWLVARRNVPETATLATLLFLAGGLLRVPLALMVLAAAAALGPWLGAVQALVGALGSAVILYGLGRFMGRARVRRLAGWKINRVHRALTRHGIMAMVVLRLMPVAAFSVINLVAGASRVALGDFVLGSALGMAPGIFAISVVGDRLVAVLRNPSAENIAVLAAATILVIVLVFALVQRLGRARVPQTR
jgi:phospholipase D1/2